MVVEQIPDPQTAQQWRVPHLWTPPRFETTSEQRAIMKRLKLGMLHCDPHAEVVAFVSKVFAVSNDNLLESSAVRKGRNKSGEHTLIALARLFSGTLRCGDTVHVLGPKYSPATPHLYRTQLTLQNLYLIMGRVLMRIDSVLPGNVFGIALPDISTSTNTLSPPLQQQQQQQQQGTIVIILLSRRTIFFVNLHSSVQ
jgi:translation elongation factor EF-G